MKKFLSALFLLPFAMASFNSAAQSPHGGLFFTAHMTGDQEIPTVTTAAEGVGVFILSPTLDTLCITVSVAGLEDTVSGINIQGVLGSPGPIAVDLTPYREGNQVFATLTGSSLPAGLIQSMLAGHYYVNALTPAHPNGEVRGQILPETNEMYVARLDSSQVVPVAASSGRGLGIFIVSSDRKSIDFTMVGRNMTGGVTSASLNAAQAGQIGSVVVDLVPFTVGTQNTVYSHGTLDSSSVPSGFAPFLTGLRSGNVYMEVYTDSIPTGEMRGQVLRDTTISFYAYLNPESVVPPVSPSFGLGLAYFSFNPSLDTLLCEAVLGGLSAPADTATLNVGATGANGPVAVDLFDGVSENLLDTAVTGIGSNLMHAMLNGNVYFTVGDANNPGGEIRGQLRSPFRTGYSYLLSGAQETPPVVSGGYGSGFASVDPDSNDVRFMFVYGGLSGPAMAAHFHVAPPGTPGPVLFPLTPFLVNDRLCAGRWTASDTVNPFTADALHSFETNDVYVNIHTAQNPNGEVRGQVMSGLVCNQFADDTITGVLSPIDYNRELNVYPNPAGADGLVTARYVSDRNSDAVLTVFDMLGKKVSEQHVDALVGTNKYTVDLSNFGRGVYTVKLTVGSSNFSQRVTRQ